jgi:hypothetical protein
MSAPMKSVASKPEHLAFLKALEAAIAQHGQNLDAVELLALTSHLVGQLIALQNHRVMTSDMAMQIVMSNMEQGNSEAMRLLATGGAA